MADMSFLLLTLIPLYSQVPLSHADQALIDRVCNATPDAARCQACLRSHPNSDPADGKTIANIVSNCSQADTARLCDTLFKLAARWTSDENLKATIAHCMDRVVSSWTYYFVLQVNLDLNCASYNQALKTISENISPKVNECLASFTSYPGGKVPPEVLTGTAGVSNDLKL